MFISRVYRDCQCIILKLIVNDKIFALSKIPEIQCHSFL